MNSPRRPKAPRCLAGALAGFVSLHGTERLLGATWSGPSDLATRPTDASAQFHFGYDHILGTSLDTSLTGCSVRDARECERRMLAEIDRLAKILNTYDPSSEISRVKAGASVESVELAEVLASYETWSARASGALGANLGDVLRLWREAAKTGRVPADAELAIAFATPRAFNVDALGKGYIVDRATLLARQFAPSGLLDIGGDLRAWGHQTWMVGVAHPLAPADNAAPLLQFPLCDAAVATSGGYARYVNIAGRRYSHLLDPRTLRPIETGLSATVVAADCLTANALSTAAAVLGATEGANLARTYGLDHLILNTVGSSGAAQPPVEINSATTVGAIAGSPWPANYQLAVTVALKPPEGFRGRRPYVAVWVEDSSQKMVRTISVWGTGKYQPDLTRWWRGLGGNHSGISSVTRATRAPGTYTVTWDGRDNQGDPVPQGDYKVFVEINREHGHHVWESATVTCSAGATFAEIAATAESDASSVAYGPKSGP